MIDFKDFRDKLKNLKRSEELRHYNAENLDNEKAIQEINGILEIIERNERIKKAVIETYNGTELEGLLKKKNLKDFGIVLRMYFLNIAYDHMLNRIKSVYEEYKKDEEVEVSIRKVETNFNGTNNKIKDALKSRFYKQPLTEKNVRELEKILQDANWSDEDKGREIFGTSREYYCRRRIKFLGKRT